MAKVRFVRGVNVYRTDNYYRSPTIKDVARAAGVSHATVSRILHGNGPASTDTKARVLAAAHRLGYVPNRIARGLKAGATGILAALVPSLDGAPTSDILANIADELMKAGCSLAVHCSFEDARRQLELLQLLRGRAADAVFFMPTSDMLVRDLPDLVESTRRAVAEAVIPVVFVDRHMDVGNLSCVCTDNRLAVAEAVRYLIAIGHRNIGYLTGPPLSSVVERLEGYREGLRQAGLEYDPRRVESLRYDSYEAGLAAATRLLQRAPELTAVIAYNPNATVGVVSAAFRTGRSVPEDLSVLAVDDVPAISSTFVPLTHVQQDAVTIGRQAARLALELLQGGEPRHVRVPARLVVGRSTAPA